MLDFRFVVFVVVKNKACKPAGTRRINTLFVFGDHVTLQNFDKPVAVPLDQIVTIMSILTHCKCYDCRIVVRVLEDQAYVVWLIGE